MMKPSKTIWLINKDAAPLTENGTHLRTIKQAQYLQSLGHTVKIVCSARVHNTEVNHVTKGMFKEETIDGVDFVFVSSIAYGNNMVKRVGAYALFSLKMWRLSGRIGKPDIVIHTSRIPFDFFVYPFARCHKARYILDVTDLWPMEFEHFGFLKASNPILKAFYLIERYLYTKAEHVVMSFEGCLNYLREKGWTDKDGGPIKESKVHYVNNGISIADFRKNIAENRVEDEDLNDDSTFKVVYLGAIRKANNLDTLIKAAELLKENKAIKFLIYGDGDERESLEQYCQDNHLNNVIFKAKWTLPKFVPYILTKASINLLNYAPGWAPYGGSMNKMFMSFAAGRPILCNAGMKYSPIRDHNLGIDAIFQSSREYADAIIEMYNYDKTTLEGIKQRSVTLSETFDTTLLCQQFVDYCKI